jgi:ribosomal protein L11 methyltransferase
MSPIPDLWRIALIVPEALVEFFSDAVADHVVSVSNFEIEEGGNWLIEAISHGEPDRSWLTSRVAVLAEAVGIPEPEITFEPVPQLDWLTKSYQSFPPIRAGRCFIHGSHFEGKVPASSIGLLVDAATAFGSGEHATTFGCLVALDRLSKRFPVRRALDMGCGSGILALAIAKLWHVPVVASDIDAESVRVARLNARRNKVADLVHAVGGVGYKVAAVRRGRPYDLIASNILARPLARMAPDLRKALRPGGYVVLSGLLDRHENWVLAAHRAQGLRLVGRVPVGEWRTLILRG